METVNVTLERCDHGATCSYLPHRPVLIPCPIPRTVEMTVRLGKCAGCIMPVAHYPDHQHAVGCPARPIRVTCSIGGDGTWAESTVTCVQDTWPHETLLLTACRERWEIVKALVTGVQPDFEGGAWTGPTLPLFEQRDTVFAALAKMACLEEEHETARLTLPASCRPIPPTGSDTPRPSADALRLFVSHLIAKVGAM